MRRAIFCLCACLNFFFFSSMAQAGINMEHSWIRMPPVADKAAAYMTLRNDSSRDVVVAAVSSSMLKQDQAVHVPLQLADGSGVDLNDPVRDTRAAGEPAQLLFEKAMALVREKDLAGASVLFQRAVEKGNRRAQYQLGLLYARGGGVRKNLIRARELLHKSAMQGHPKAQFYLGQMYAFGDGGEKDNIKATMWFWIATTMGDRFAMDSLRMMTSKISSREMTIAKKRARALWRKIPHDMKTERGSAMN